MADTQHSAITDPNIHEPKGAASAAAGTWYIADGLGSGSWTTSSSESIDNQVIVKTSADFPTPVSDVITLAADTIYLLDGDIDIGNDRFVLSNNTTIRGLGGQHSSITTTTTSNVFTASGNFHLDAFKLTASTATVFSLAGGAFESAYIREFTVNSCSSMGSATNWYSFFWESGAVVSTTSPISFVGTCTICIFDLVEFITGYTTAIDFGTATFNTLSLNRCGFGYASATNHVIIAANSANINTNKEGRITGCNFDSGATNIVSGFDVGDIRWEARNNLGLSNTTRNAQGYMHTTTTTTIGVGDGDSGNPKIVNGGTNWVYAHDDQFTVSTSGRFTYDGIITAEFLVNCNVSGTTASGTQTVSHYLAKNGSIITASKTNREYTSTAVGSPAPATALVTMATGDYIELFLENETGTNDWDSYILNMTISEVI